VPVRPKTHATAPFEVLADPVRCRIVEILARRPQAAGEIVGMVQREFDITQAAVSQHLRVLRTNGFASVRVDGARRIYSIDARPLQVIDAWLERFRIFWARQLQTLSHEITRVKRRRRDT
jgi:DNA-binding transcriptional ArsR family regulator